MRTGLVVVSPTTVQPRRICPDVVRDAVRLEAGGTFDQWVPTVAVDEALEVCPAPLTAVTR